MVEAFISEIVFHQLDTRASLSWGLYVQQLVAPNRRHLESSSKENRHGGPMYFASCPVLSPHVPRLGHSMVEPNIGLEKLTFLIAGKF
jgi:hypothetical protein